MVFKCLFLTTDVKGTSAFWTDWCMSSCSGVRECSPSLPASSTHTQCTCACICACACMHTEVLADRFVQRLVSSKRSLANINVWLEEYFENRNSFSVMPLPMQHLQHCGEFILTPCWHFTLTFLSFRRLCMKERNISRMSQSRSFSWVFWIVLCKSLCWLGFWK